MQGKVAKVNNVLKLLADVRIVDLTSIVLGPMATQTLADLGADVIKVESLDGDLARSSGVAGPDGMGAVFANNNRNKSSIALDLKAESAKAVLSRLIKDADVFVHNMRPAAIARLGFDAEAVKAIKPDIIYCAATGYGSNGPYAGRPAYDDVIQAVSGLASLPMHTGSDPAYVPSVMADKISALHIVYGILAALYDRQRTGNGCTMEVPMYESLVSFVMNEHLDAATFSDNAEPGYGRLLNPNRRPFKTADGWLAVMPYNESQWTRLLSLLDRGDVLNEDWFASAAGRNSHSAFLYGILVEEMPKESTEVWIQKLVDLDIPHSPVNTLSDLLDDPHLKHTGFFNSTDDLPGRARSVAQPVIFNEAPVGPDTAAPKVGEHTEAVMLKLGYSTEQILQLQQAGVLKQTAGSVNT
jgi:crotonobetainyl-CoA:carnitine CoA-transferase CaiB-like acyl-CoA transferase